MRDHKGRLLPRFGPRETDRERKARLQRIAGLRLGASGMRYFGDYAEAEAMEFEASRLEGENR